MDSGEGYHRDVEYKVSICKHLSGDIMIVVICGGWHNSKQFAPDCDISLYLGGLGLKIREHFDKVRKAKFLEWVNAPEPCAS